MFADGRGGASQNKHRQLRILVMAHANLDVIAHSCWQRPLPSIANALFLPKHNRKRPRSRNAPTRCTAGSITCVVCVAVHCVVFLCTLLQSDVQARPQENKCVHSHAHS